MASSEDFKKFCELYQTEGVPNGVSIVDFCQRNEVVYKQFERWFKKRYSKNETGFHKVRVVGADVEPSFIGRGKTRSGMLRLYHGRIVEQAYTPVRLYPHQSGADDSAKQPNLPAAAVFGREAGGAMLAITGATRRPGHRVEGGKTSV